MVKTLVINKKNLIEALAFGGMCAGINKNMPICDYIRLTCEEGESTVKIVSNSVDIAVKTTVQAEQPAIEKIDYCVPASFVKTISTLTDYNVTLEFEDNAFRVKYHNGVAKYPSLTTEEYPQNFDTENGNLFNKCELPAQTLKYILGSCKNFMGNDDLRPMMQTICLTFGENNIEYCATDAHKLIREILSINEIVGAGTVICIHKSNHRVLNTLVGDAEGSVIIRTYERFATFEVGEKTACITLVEGKFPNYKAIVDNAAGNKKQLTVVKEELMSSVVRMMNLSNAQTNQIVFDCDTEVINISGEDLDLSVGGDENIEVKAHGEDTEPIRIGFNAQFLKDCLSEVNSHNVVINMSQPSRAATFTDENRPEKIVLIMPVQLN